jgi:hypothetical protein
MSSRLQNAILLGAIWWLLFDSYVWGIIIGCLYYLLNDFS